MKKLLVLLAASTFTLATMAQESGAKKCTAGEKKACCKGGAKDAKACAHAGEKKSCAKDSKEVKETKETKTGENSPK